MERPDGQTQYLMTIPKEYAIQLEKDGITSLYVIYNKGLGAFPEVPGFTEKALMAFLSKHPELSKLFVMEGEY